MRRLASVVLLTAAISLGCAERGADAAPELHYRGPSRFTDPESQGDLLEVIPAEPVAIAELARNLTVHNNLLVYFDVPQDRWSELPSVWPPRASEMLKTLRSTGSGDLEGERAASQRLRGACMSESHLLAAFLRYRGIPARVRAGYFRDVYVDNEQIVEFWEKNARAKGIAQDLYEEDPVRWREVNHDYTRQQIELNKCVEHWVVEFQDEATGEWKLLDANNTFLKAMSDIDVGVLLPRRYFEFAYEAWFELRESADFDPDRYAEWPQDGPSHIRSQLLWDFYSLLNHDIAGYDKDSWDTDDSAERQTYEFVKETSFEEVEPLDLEELDALARLLAKDPSVDELVDFYEKSRHLRRSSIEADAYSFVAGAVTSSDL